MQFPISSEALLSYVRAYVARDDKRSESAYLNDPPKDESELQDLRMEAEARLAMLQKPNKGECDQFVQSVWKKIVQHEGAMGSSLPDDIAQYVRRGLIEIYRRKLDRYNDTYGAAWHDMIFAPNAPVTVPFGVHAKTYLDEKAEEWKASKIGLSRQAKVRAIVATLTELVGENTPIASVEDEVVQKVRQALKLIYSKRAKAVVTIESIYESVP